MSAPNRRYKGLLLDFGGGITTDFFASIDDHLQRLGLPRGHFRQLVTTDPAGRALYQRVERGEISQAVIVSGEVGIRKPDPAVYLLAAEKLALPARWSRSSRERATQATLGQQRGSLAAPSAARQPAVGASSAPMRPS